MKKILLFGLRFIKRNYINFVTTYRQFNVNQNKDQKENAISKDKAKYLRRLSKATLSIFLRNIIQLKLSIVFLLMKGAYALRISKVSNSIKFFKQKK